jgi:excisionase family DNA binding protein
MPPPDAATGRGRCLDRQMEWRVQCRDAVLQSALRKRAAGVPTYTVPEAAALLSVSKEHLYRLVRADAFPVVRMCTGGNHGRYIVPAKAVDNLLDAATEGGNRDVAEWAKAWQAHFASSDTGGGDAA